MTNFCGLDPADHDRCMHLLRAAGHAAPPALVPLAGGANSRVYRVETSGGPLLLKVYYRHPDDPRDRLAADYGFTAFAWDHGIDAVARPIGCDRAAGLALYEFIAGTKLEPAEIGTDAAEQALAFFRAVNAHRHTERARALPDAAEACFSLQAHLDVVARRLARLCAIDGNTPVDAAAARFVRARLAPLGQAVLEVVAGEAARYGVALAAALPDMDRCLSPSDFGFHNALAQADGRLRFIDFEYAGWDDPGKMIADFFCQPERPVPVALFATFARAVAANLAEPEQATWRFGLLLPLYRVKWCCIMLNDFLPAANLRRRFAGGALAEEERKWRQLDRATRALAGIELPGSGRAA
jgi:hypothetical protein